MDQAEVTVGAEDDGGRLATCGRSMRWHGHVSDEGDVVFVRLRRTRWRGSQGDASGAGELAREGTMGVLPSPVAGRGLIGTAVGKLQNWSSIGRHSRRGGDGS